MAETRMIFSAEFNEGLVGRFLSDLTFALKAKLYVQPDWFQDPRLSEVTLQLFNYIDRYSKLPLPNDLYEYFPSKDRSLYIDTIQKCRISSGNFSFEVLENKLTNFIKLQSTRDLTYGIEQRFNAGKIDEALEYANKETTKVSMINLGRDKSFDFNDPDAFLDRMKASGESCASIGHEEFDSSLKPGSRLEGVLSKNEQPKYNILYDDKGSPSVQWFHELSLLSKGALTRGETTIVIGATNSGKTTFIHTIIAHNILLGKKVLYISHEDTSDNLVRKLIRTIAGFTNNDLDSIHTNKQNYEKFMVAYKLLQDKLTFLSIVDPAEMYIENIVALVRHHQQKLTAETGSGYDLVIDDYPKLLKSKSFDRNRGQNPRIEIHDCYLQLKQLAQSLMFALIMPAQANRDGAKKQFIGKEMNNEDVGEAYGIAQDSHTVITINRSPEDIKDHLLTFLISKSRNNIQNCKFVTVTDFARNRTHGFGLMGVVKTPFDKEEDSLIRGVLLKKTSQQDLNTMANNLTVEKKGNS